MIGLTRWEVEPRFARQLSVRWAAPTCQRYETSILAISHPTNTTHDLITVHARTRRPALIYSIHARTPGTIVLP